MAGRPGAPIRNVPQGDILNNDAILMEQWTVFTLVPIFSRTQLGQLEFLAARRFIRNEMLCDTCGARCGLIRTRSRRQESHDGFRWRCRPCHYVKSIHTNNVEKLWMRAKRQLNATSARLASCFQPTSASSCGGKEFERNETPSAPCSAAFISSTLSDRF